MKHIKYDWKKRYNSYYAFNNKIHSSSVYEKHYNEFGIFRNSNLRKADQ